jgi:hypothetical protein
MMILDGVISLFEHRIYWIFCCQTISCEWKIRLKLDVACKCILWIFFFLLCWNLLAYLVSGWYRIEKPVLACKCNFTLRSALVGQVLFFGFLFVYFSQQEKWGMQYCNHSIFSFLKNRKKWGLHYNHKFWLWLYCNIKCTWYNIIKFVSDLWQVSGFLHVLRFPPTIKLTATI